MGIENIEFTFYYGESNAPKPERSIFEAKKKETLERISRYLDDFYETTDGFNWVTIAIGHDVGVNG
jgi:hypothetical protein